MSGPVRPPFVPRGEIRAHLMSAAVGALSVVLIVAAPRAPWLSGFAYFLLGPLHGFHGWWTGRAIERAAESQASAEAVPPNAEPGAPEADAFSS